MENLYYDRKTKACVNFPWSEARWGLSHTAGEVYTHSTESEACVSVLNITVDMKHGRCHDAELTHTGTEFGCRMRFTGIHELILPSHTHVSVISRVPLTGLSNTRWRWERIYITGGTCYTHTHTLTYTHTLPLSVYLGKQGVEESRDVRHGTQIQESVISMIQHSHVWWWSVCSQSFSDLSWPQGKKKRRKRDKQQDSSSGTCLCVHIFTEHICMIIRYQS